MAKISFELQESEELRKAIREMIGGELVGTVRDMVKEEIEKHLAQSVNAAMPSETSIKRYADSKMRETVENQIFSALGMSNSNDRAKNLNLSKTFLLAMVAEILTEWLVSNSARASIELAKARVDAANRVLAGMEKKEE